MKNNNSTSFIIISGIVILCVFASVIALNMLPNNKESTSYFVKVEDELEAKIDSIDFINGEIILKTIGNPKEYCIKTTKSEPDISNICWKEIFDNKAITKAYGYKKYYVWIKDKKGNISKSKSINTN